MRARTSRLRLGLGSAFAVAVLVAGCGGSSTLSHAKLLSEASAACQQANTAAARLPTPGDSYSALASYAHRLTPIVERLVDKLDGLKPSAADRPALDRYIAALRDGERSLTLLGSASSPAQVDQAVSLVTSRSIPRLAVDLGAAACGESPST